MSIARLAIGAVIAIVIVAILVACGATSETGSETTLASWRDAACSTVTSFAKVMDSEPPSAEDNALLPPPETSVRQLKAMQDVAAELRKIPLPTQAEHRRDAERFVEVVTTAAESYEAALPRIEAASRRLDRVLKSVADDETPLPPAPEGSTVAGGIMAQMMSVPEVQEAWTELMSAYEAAASDIDDEETDRLEKSLGLEQCEQLSGGTREEQLSAEELARCGSRGDPVSLSELVEVFRAHGISLAIDEHTCTVPLEKRVAGFDSDATNAGPTGSDRSDEIEVEEGHVLCSVENFGVDHELVVNKYGTDVETTFRVHNIDCALYPHSTSREAEQIARVKKAMEAVGSSVPLP